MAPTPASLDDLRARIDAIDQQLHDLIMQRAELMEGVAEAKRSGSLPMLRPGREAQVMRRLVARHQGRFPVASLVRIWRELVCGALVIQGEFAVAVYAPENDGGYWDLARDHFCGGAPMTAHRSLGEVVRAVTEGRATVGVLPVPEEGADQESWWRFLAASDTANAHVVARLPFFGRGTGRGEGREAFVISRAQPEASGADRSLVVIETDDVSRARLISTLAGAGFSVTHFAGVDSGGALAANLVEIDDLVAPSDPRLAAALTPLGEKVVRISFLGIYARPLSASGA
jgi:chorismate mutase / prephenate dehydratase